MRGHLHHDRDQLNLLVLALVLQLAALGLLLFQCLDPLVLLAASQVVSLLLVEVPLL